MVFSRRECKKKMPYKVCEALLTIVIENKTVDKVSSSYVKKREELGTHMDPNSIDLDLFSKKCHLKKKGV